MAVKKDTRIGLDNLIYGWELRHPQGQPLPHVNLLARAVRQEGNKLQLYQMLDPGFILIGRCMIIQTTGKCFRFSSGYFTIGPHGPGCGPSEFQITGHANIHYLFIVIFTFHGD